jgi:hypothetical protein
MAPHVGVAMYQRSYPQAQLLSHVCSHLPVSQSNVLKCRVSHASSALRPPVLTSSPPQLLSATGIAPQDTLDLSAASALKDTKPVTHA